MPQKYFWEENDLPFFHNVPYTYTKFFLNIQCIYILSFKLQFACHFFGEIQQYGARVGPIFPTNAIR